MTALGQERLLAEPPLCRFGVVGVPASQGSKTARILGKRIRVNGQLAILNPKVTMMEVGNMTTKTRKAGALDRWRDEVARVARASYHAEPARGGVILTCEFVLVRPGSHYTKSGRLTKSAPRCHQSMPDLSKLTRAVEDALSGIVYSDDAKIVGYGKGHRKRYGERGEAPGVQVTVEAAA